MRSRAAVSALALALAATLAAAHREPQSAPPEILWDRWGVPHIYAADEPGAAFAFGWAQAQAHGDLLLTLYGQARGRAAEYWGPGGGNLDEDRWLHTLGLPQLADSVAAASDLEERAYVEAFVAGINAYARAHTAAMTDSVRQVLPARLADVYAHGLRLTLSFAGAQRQQISGQTRAWRETGSNAWAVAPRRTARGHALLLANPHLPWNGITTWFESHHTTPAGWRYGAALVGSPAIQIAFNDRLGWTHTTNTQDVTDLYELRLEGNGYRWDGATRPFTERVAVLRVRDGATTRPETLRVRSSVHGPIVAERAGGALALRTTALATTSAVAQWLAMARARDLAGFERALARQQALKQNTIYADADGHILYHYGGILPVRPTPDRAAWAGRVRGDTSGMLWTTVHGYADMPRVLDPPTGWLQNSNDPPWSSTFPVALDPGRFPPYFAPLGVSFRTQRSIKLVREDSAFTFESFVAAKHVTRVEAADRLLDDLLAAVGAAGDPAAQRAAAVLTAWDRNANADSRGAVLFEAWRQEYLRRLRGRAFYAQTQSPLAPLSTPDGLGAPDTAVAALTAAAEAVTRAWGSADVAWGDVYRLRRDAVDLPANGGSAALGIFRVVGFDSSGAGGRYVADGGDSYVAVTEFSNPVRAAALISYGNWSQPGSPHRADQLALFARRELRPVWLDRATVEANLERREVVPMPAPAGASRRRP